MLLDALDYIRPATLEEALTALRSRPHARALAGGQSLLNVLKLRAAHIELLVDIARLSELRYIEARDGALEIGAATTYAEIAAAPQLQEALPGMAGMSAHLVDVQVRNRGTIGGNCCYADPCSNFPPLLVALDAELRIASSDGERVVAASQFFAGAFQTALEPGELLLSVRIPLPPSGTGLGYESIQLMPDSWALARAVAVVAANGTVESSARIVLGAVEPVPRRQEHVEQLLTGRPPTPDGAAEAASAVDELPRAIADVHGSSEYRRKLARVVVRRAILAALEDAGAR